MAILKKLQLHPNPNMAAIKKLEKKINLWLEQEDIKWKQRAKNNWYKEVIKTPNTFISVQIRGVNTTKFRKLLILMELWSMPN